jgi:diguanylate cyclase (GGDEF)-like protein
LLADRLTQALAQSTRRNRHCALLFIDLDRFKEVNDVHGHEIGDLLLVQAAQRLRSCVRAEDTVCRIGGDEFVVLLSDTSSTTDAVVVANKIRLSLSQPFALRGLSATVECSIGIASFPEHGRTEQELMSAADTAMYAAKESGRNAVFVGSSNSVPSRHDMA